MTGAVKQKPWWFRFLKRVVIALVVGVIVFFVRHWMSEKNAESDARKELDKYSVGQCLILTKAASGLGNVNASDAPCDRDPSYTVASRIGADTKCPNESYVEYSLEVGFKSAGKLCLVENLVAGHCYEDDMFTKIIKLNNSCGGLASANPFRVLSRTETDGAPCPDSTTPITYPLPPRTYCVTAVDTI
ncbi:hypothetical protein FZI91_10720 [Mycobacterium sp. CBMA271]|uniref:hypothetical protein n=1 Tax=unclassified Mycobacteroides TaxID=2618759 RepID=UPI0012DD9168|nr:MULTISPECIES: hypothetical protein [unclassified Mycobacteroides]MUM22175.1 hypothetical protein [Mycobacteroides sp. CBMA 271]